MQIRKYVPKFMQGVIAILTTVLLLSSCTTYVDTGPGPRHWVPAHYNRMGYWIPGHYAGGGYNGRVWVAPHHNRFGAWVPGRWR